MEAISLRKWFKTNLHHAKSSSNSSDCVIEAPPSSNSTSETSGDVLVTVADAGRSQLEPLPANAIENSRASPRVSLITKKGKGKSADGSSVPIERNGLHLIYQPPPDLIETTALNKQCPIDIVAVHGIMGDAYTTWTHSNGHFWLRDSLPDEVPSARIFSYGYPANVFLSLEKGRIDDHATTLLEDLRDMRKSPEDERRPIVFICHSMGGIVVKKAINMTVVDPTRFSNIRTSTAAIFFLATPHCGSDPAKMLSVCADILNIPITSTGFARFSGKLRSDMIKTLAPGSTTLLDISSDFKSHPRNIKIFSFLEQKSTPPSSGKVVDDMSGRMFVDGEVRVPMPGCNHREVARFESKDSNGYKKIINKLNEVASEITNKLTVELQAEDLPCLASLTFPSISHRLSSLSSSLSETCTWILSHPSFVAWTSQNQNKNLLYIKGHPGTGKSTLMSFLHRFYQSQPSHYRRILLSFFFHGNGDPLQKSQVGMFRALLCQLYRQSLSARRTILVAFNAKKENHSSEEGGNAVWTLEELQTLFSEIVLSEQMGENEVIILIDALDEAMDEGSKAATKLLEFFHRLIEAVVAKRRKTKVCISCREYPVVAVSGGSLQISIQDSNRQDIERFVSYQLRIGVEGWELQPEKVRTDLENAIVQKADGVFLWVAKRMQRIVEELNDGSSSFADVQRLVERESNELYVMYEDILSREVKQSARQKAKLFLGWVCLAERPLSLTEIRIAMACDAGCIVDGQERIEESKEFVEEDTRMQRLVKSLSGGLAEVRLCTDGTTVQLIHQTVSEFLCEGGLRTLFTDTRDSKALSLSDAEVIGRCENALSRACFNYLRLGEIASFSMTYGTLPVPTVCQVEERFPFIRYAVMFCFLHAQRAEFLGISQDDLPAIVDHSTEAAIFDIPESNEIRVSHHPPSIFETWKVMFEAVRRLYEQPLVPGLQLIHTAAYCNLQSTVRYLVEKRGQIEVKNRVQETALHHAVRGGHEDLVRWLLDSGADIESENISLSTPLELAIKNRHDHIIKLLLERGADANKQTGSFSNMLEAACNAKGRVELIEHLIDCGAEVNGLGGAVVKRGTALEEAAHAGDEEAVRLLIAKGANVHAMSEYYGGALQAAVQGLKGPRSYAKAVVELLLQERVDINAQGGEYGNALQAAAKYSSLDVIELLLDSGADVNAQGGYYGNALQAACDNINVGDGEEAVQMLLSRGADVNARGGYYGSAIQSAAFSGNSNTFRTLFERGARIDIKGGIHQNMIEAAGAGGNREIFQLLLDNGADINEQGGTYGTALQAAVFYSSGNFVEFLLDNGADLNLQGGFFGNALCATVEGGRGEKMVEILLKRGADVHACAPGHLSALQMVLKKGNAKQMKLLLEHGNDINAQMSGMLRFFRA